MDTSKYIGETTEYDKKQEVERRKVKSWLKSVSAFANGNGGTLLFGIADDDTVVGLSDAKSDAEFVSQKIKERIDPIPQITITMEHEEGKDLLILRVQGGDDTPYYYIGDGVMETFVRIGNESVIADSTDHKRLVLKGSNASFDARQTEEAFADNAFTKMCSRYYAWNGISFDNKLYHSFGLIGSNGMLTNAGLLMSDDCSIRQSRVFCTRWNGNTKASGDVDALDSQEISGGIVTLLEDTMAFIRRNNRTMWYKESMQRVEVPEYIERSVMEAVVNAIAHRDYLIQGSEVHVDMYNDRLVIYSPGCMPEGRIVQEMKIEDIPSVRRNPVLADILSQLGYMERKGSGLGKIVNPIKGLSYFTERMLPQFFSDRAQFTITFPNILLAWQQNHSKVDAYPMDNNDTQDDTQDDTQGDTQEIVLDDWIVEKITKNPKITTEELATKAGVGIITIKRHIAKMPHVQYVGSGYSGHWEVVKKE